MVFCSSCGEKQANDSAKFCSKCGTKIATPNNVNSPKSNSPKSNSPKSYSPKNQGYSSTIQTHSGSGANYTTGGSVKKVTEGQAYGEQSTFNEVKSLNNGAAKCGLAKTTYEKQPSWAFAEQHKNQTGQYKHGQFRHLNQ